MTTQLEVPAQETGSGAPAVRPPTAPAPQRPASTRHAAIFAVVLGLLAAGSLILLLTTTRDRTAASEASVLSQTEVADILLRGTYGPDGLELEYLYAPTWYFEWSGREVPATDGRPTLAFFMIETIHEGELGSVVPRAALVGTGGSVTPSDLQEVSSAPHHRVSLLLFPAVAADGTTPLTGEGGDPLVVSTAFDDGTVVSVAWAQPMPNGLGVINGTSAAGRLRSPALSLGALLAIFSGMLTALSPCLLLLGTYYTAVLSGTAAAADRSNAERRLLTTGVFFVAGLTAVYTAGGIVAGFVGESVSRYESIGAWARPVSIVAGVLVVGLGIRMAAQARVPIACKIPVVNRPARSGWLGSALMGSTFAVGCLSCFSATVLTALLLYAGATGSPLAGGLIMLTFSAGVGLMFLLAAVLVARAAPVATWLTRAQPVIGTVSAVVMIALGTLMITYRFHTLTGYLLRSWS